MFSSIVGQENIVDQLTKDWKNNQLASSNLIFGHKFTGKLSIALELARIITCKNEATAQCLCSSCLLNKNLLHPNVFLLGERYFLKEIEASLQTVEAFIHYNKPIPDSVKLLLIVCVRKLLRRFDSCLWEEHDPRYKEAKNTVLELNTLLIRDIDNQEHILIDSLKVVLIHAKEIANVLNNYSINIGQIRSVIEHCYSLAGSKRVVIMEQAHLMQDSARNALLKVLEEPQSNLYFILITTQKEKIIPTILSRVRCYATSQRGHDIEQKVIKKFFRNDHIKSLETLLSNIPPTDIEALAQKFLSSIKNSNSIYLVYSSIERDTLIFHISDFLKKIYEIIIQSKEPISFKNRALPILTLGHEGYSNYHQNPEIIIYSIHNQLSKMYKDQKKSKHMSS